ncbi:hypothetical protein BV210_10740 [Halorientalis sp. IM1011]|uniref:hypothetical protein n=1 Tax=Halorientalis sp. IM1011 TaxID=1932360 RepID=UPI00097CCFE9|nr:hypothetical protein [Halorientalis sp. IM1011]AQL43164.1 hypothetical protein BV210_10740 [Halorientalis sp. IM1011]
MRQITRRVTLAILVAIVLLLALGALPGYLKSGDPYYVTATATDDRTAVPADALAPNRYPYTTAALANATGNGTENATGRSGPYWKGPVGFKGAFTHSPFDEIDAIRGRNASAATDSAVFVRANGTVYRLEVTQTP